MTTADLLDIIARDRSPVRTIGSLSTHGRCTRRSIEEAIQTARLEGVPVITDGGVRVATTAKEWTTLVDWLDARMVTQRRTVNALTAARDQRAKDDPAWAAPAVSRAAGATLTLWPEVVAA